MPAVRKGFCVVCVDLSLRVISLAAYELYPCTVLGQGGDSSAPFLKVESACMYQFHCFGQDQSSFCSVSCDDFG